MLSMISLPNLRAIRFYDAVDFFGLVKPNPQSCRRFRYEKNYAGKIRIICLLTSKKNKKKYQREVAYEIFKPTISDFPEYAVPSEALSGNSR